jgi:hypothetical protein
MKQILILICALAFSACTTNQAGKTVPDVPRIVATVKEAATVGTQLALIQKPESKTTFLKVESELLTLAAQPDITVERLFAILDQLPVKKLKSSKAQLIIGGARITVAAAGWSNVDIIRAEQLKPVTIAIVDGMMAGGAVP